MSGLDGCLLRTATSSEAIATAPATPVRYVGVTDRELAGNAAAAEATPSNVNIKG